MKFVIGIEVQLVEVIGLQRLFSSTYEAGIVNLLSILTQYSRIGTSGLLTAVHEIVTRVGEAEI